MIDYIKLTNLVSIYACAISFVVRHYLIRLGSHLHFISVHAQQLLSLTTYITTPSEILP